MSLKFTSACSMHFPKPLNQRISPVPAGWARERYGGNVPLIGFASWARTENEEDLVVEEGLFNFDQALPASWRAPARPAAAPRSAPWRSTSPPTMPARASAGRAASEPPRSPTRRPPLPTRRGGA
jgi:hypothetical protein